MATDLAVSYHLHFPLKVKEADNDLVPPLQFNSQADTAPRPVSGHAHSLRPPSARPNSDRPSSNRPHTALP